MSDPGGVSPPLAEVLQGAAHVWAAFAAGQSLDRALAAQVSSDPLLRAAVQDVSYGAVRCRALSERVITELATRAPARRCESAARGGTGATAGAAPRPAHRRRPGSGRRARRARNVGGRRLCECDPAQFSATAGWSWSIAFSRRMRFATTRRGGGSTRCVRRNRSGGARCWRAPERHRHSCCASTSGASAWRTTCSAWPATT